MATAQNGKTGTSTPPIPPQGPTYAAAASGGVVPGPAGASAVAASAAPKKANGVLIRRVKDVALAEALDAVAKVMPPSKIIYADYMGASNYGIWLDSEESVDLLAGLETLEVKGQLTRIYRYANPVRKVVLRNVPPFIDDFILINELSK